MGARFRFLRASVYCCVLRSMMDQNLASVCGKPVLISRCWSERRAIRVMRRCDSECDAVLDDQFEVGPEFGEWGFWFSAEVDCDVLFGGHAQRIRYCGYLLNVAKIIFVLLRAFSEEKHAFARIFARAPIEIAVVAADCFWQA